MTLTLTEKKYITRMVIHSSNGLLSEVKYDSLMKDEIRFNLYFYNVVKEAFFGKNENQTLLTEDILSALGGIKDLLTGVDVVKKFTDWLKDKLVPKLVAQIERVVPGVNELATKLADYIKRAVDWIKKTLSYDGISKLFAMAKYRTLAPSTEQKKCMLLAAKSAYRYILIMLVTAFLIKITGYSVDAVDTIINQASTFGDFDMLLAGAGLPKFVSLLFGGYGSYTKADKARKLKSDIEKKREEFSQPALINFKKDWGYCDNKGIE